MFVNADFYGLRLPIHFLFGNHDVLTNKTTTFYLGDITILHCGSKYCFLKVLIFHKLISNFPVTVGIIHNYIVMICHNSKSRKFTQISCMLYVIGVDHLLKS